MNNPFSSLSRRERFLCYIILSVVTAAIIGFAIYAGMLLHEKVRRAGAVSGPGPATSGYANGGDNLVNPPDVWNAQKNGSTNETAATPESADSQTNSN